jgi:CheY-like chemotaxis protein
VLGDILMSAGHKAAVVTNGRHAVERLRAEPFDVVLTDLAMPGMTGWEMAQAVKTIAPTVRVVLVSGFGVEVSAEDMRAHGVDLVLAKPIRYEELTGALASLRRTRT